jgi:MoaA/NifB/PqqE/SkfB family radical SAM enzyme
VIALHGSQASVHDRVTRRPRSFEDTLAGIRHVVTLGFPVWGKVVLSRLNLADALATVRLLASMAVRRVTIAFPRVEDFDDAVFREVVPRYRDLVCFLRDLANSLQENSSTRFAGPGDHSLLHPAGRGSLPLLHGYRVHTRQVAAGRHEHPDGDG